MNEPIRHRRKRSFQLSQPVFMLVMAIGSSVIAGAIIAVTINTIRS